ncbi:hypothetical protein COU80_02155 [Candidatus Peregrinibacteria bacterium CG10_big_fil_rev_8_21_14_0_10_55_24]|nr:MAG: hypothetical protein COU80_02155 [Candidatus Peregrinibacteria bacterium CG10_big_fil_rev_8_21_14_0_10_55_24]
MKLSYSQLRQYRLCPRQYEYGTVKKIPRAITPPESFGASVHNTLKKWGEEEMRGQGLVVRSQLDLFGEGTTTTGIATQRLLSEQDLLDLWHSSFSVDAYATRVEADYALLRGEELLRKFHRWWSREPRRVLAVEKSFSISLDATLVNGRIDRVEECADGVRIIDYKTSQPQDQQSIDVDLQLSLYALALRELYDVPCREIVMLYLGEEIVERITQRSNRQLRDAQVQIRALEERIASGDYHPTPSAPVCRRCPYRGICDIAAA